MHNLLSTNAPPATAMAMIRSHTMAASVDNPTLSDPDDSAPESPKGGKPHVQYRCKSEETLATTTLILKVSSLLHRYCTASNVAPTARITGCGE
jgi:hypothetical protein